MMHTLAVCAKLQVVASRPGLACVRLYSADILKADFSSDEAH